MLSERISPPGFVRSGTYPAPDCFAEAYSMGGYAAAAALDSSEIAGAVSISAFNSPVETMHYYAKQ